MRHERWGRAGWCAALAALVVGMVGVAACDRGERTTAVDLLRVFPFTDVGQTVERIDLGTPAASALLRSGWSAPTALPGGASGAWAIARRATVQLVIARPADAVLVVRCGLLGERAPRAALLTVNVNGWRLGRIRVRQTLAEYRVRFPARYQRAGMNVLRFSNALLAGLPRRGEQQWTRAVAVDWLRLEGVNGGARPALTADADAPALVLPGTARVDFFVRLPEGAELDADVRPADGGNGAALQVGMAVDGAAERVLAEDVRPPTTLRLPLAGPTDAIARITVAATGQGALRLERLTVDGTPAPAPGGSAPAPSPTEPRRGGATADRPDVVLFLIDTLRADHLGCYGYGAATSPHIDAFANDGILFTSYRAQASWTLPATASIMTGLDPLDHGAVALTSAMRPDAVTLAEVLRAQGYRTAGFVTNVNVRGELGFRRGFETYTYLPEDPQRPTLHVPAGELVERATAWLDEHTGEPVFLYLHATDPHAPYRPPPEVAAAVAPPIARPAEIADVDDPLPLMIREPSARTPESMAWLQAQYDGDIRVADEAFGRLLEALRARGRYERTMVVVTADHGEEFGDHGGFQHGRTLYREMLSVPLVIRRPDDLGRGRRIDALANQTDLMPTVLASLRIPVPARARGRNLLAPAGGAAIVRESVAHTSLGSRESFALTTTSWKVVQSAGTRLASIEVYDLGGDPVERHDIAADHPALVGYARQAFARLATEAPRRAYGEAVDEGSVDAETAERLKALGYVAE